MQARAAGILTAALMGTTGWATAQKPDRSPAHDSAQMIRPGLWRGWIQMVNADSVRVTFMVETRGKDIYLTMRSRNGGDYGMGDVKLKDDVLTFTWALGVGSFLPCRLVRRDGRSFDGECNDRRPSPQDGKTLKVWMTMIPPDTTVRN